VIEAIRDPVWQFVGVLVAVLSLAAAFWIYWLQQQTKELAFGLLSARRLLSVSDELSSRVTVQLDGISVGSLHLLVFGLKNSGHRAVVPADFEQHLCIQFSDGQVVSAEIAAQIPSDLGAKLTTSDTTVELQPILLNSGDQMLLQVLLSSATPRYALEARVQDISSFAPINSRPRLPPFLASGLPMMMIAFIAIGVAYLNFSDNLKQGYLFLGTAALIPVFGIATRVLQDYGKSARRRIREAQPIADTYKMARRRASDID
jgi:hypothetical protein